MDCNNNYNCHCCGCYNECDNDHKCVEVEAMTKEDVLTFWNIIKSKFARISHKHSAGDIDSGVLSVEYGGSGLDESPLLKTDLSSEDEDEVMLEHSRPGVEGVLPVSHGGTGADNAADALANLGGASESHTHNFTNDIIFDEEHPAVPIGKGGTGADNVDDARENLHIPGNYNENSGANVIPVNQGGTGAENYTDALANLHAAAENHTHSADDIDDGILGIGHGGTGANTATEARENLGAAAVDHTHYTMATAKQHHEADPDSDNQVLSGAGYISFNEYIAAAPNTILKRDPSSGSTFNAIKIPTAGNYLVSAQLNYKPTSNVNVAVAIMRVREGEELRIARAMNLCSSSENTALAIPMQFVTDLEAGDLIKLYVSAAGKVVTQSGAALTVMYFDSGVIVDA